jgi:hypothetical protein
VSGTFSTGSSKAPTFPLVLPTELPELPRRASYPPQEYTQQGWEADLTTPNRNAGTTFPHLYLFPGNSVDGPKDFAECAYATFRFQVPTLQEELKVHSFFDDETAPVEGTLFVGVANWWEGTWDWFPWQEAVDIPELSAHKRLEDGMIMVTFFQTGGELLKLYSVSVGERFHLRAYLYFDGASTTVPKDTQINFTAEASFVGSIDNIEWDFDGDGTFETQGANLGEPNSHVFATSGEYDTTLRITGTPLDGGPVETDTEVVHFIVTES